MESSELLTASSELHRNNLELSIEFLPLCGYDRYTTLAFRLDYLGPQVRKTV